MTERKPLPTQQHVVVLGASPKPERYSNQAVRLLLEHNHRVTPVNPGADRIESLPCARALSDIETPVDTLSLYRNASQLAEQTDAIASLNPSRVIFNPGTESWALQQALTQAGISWQESCTLVLLRNGHF